MAFWGQALNAGTSGLIEGVNAAIAQQGALQQMKRQKEYDEYRRQHKADEMELRKGALELQKGSLAYQNRALDDLIANRARDDAYRQGAQKLQEREQDIRDFKFEREKQDAERLDAANWSKQAITTLASGGQVDPDEFEKNYSKATGGFSPRMLFSPEMQQHEQTFADWQAGKIRDYNDPRVHSAIKFMFPDMVKRGLGEWTTQDINGQNVSGKIVEKDIDKIGRIPDGQDGAGNLVAQMRVKIVDDKGNLHEYHAPLTMYGSSHPDDQLMMVSPVELNNRAMRIAQLRQVVQSHPQMAEMFGSKTLDAKDQAEIAYKNAQTDAERYKMDHGYYDREDEEGGALPGSRSSRAGGRGKPEEFDAKKVGEHFSQILGTEPQAQSWLDRRFGAGNWESSGGDPVQSASTEALRDANDLLIQNRDVGMSNELAKQLVSAGKFERKRRPDGVIVEAYQDPKTGKRFLVRELPPGGQQPAAAPTATKPAPVAQPAQGALPTTPAAAPEPEQPRRSVLDWARDKRKAVEADLADRERRAQEQGGIRGALLGGR